MNYGLKWTKVDNKWVPMRDIVEVEPSDNVGTATNLERQNLILFVIEPDNQSEYVNYNPNFLYLCRSLIVFPSSNLAVAHFPFLSCYTRVSLFL